jgi:tRNA G46 methylase TrmB
MPTYGSGSSRERKGLLRQKQHGHRRVQGRRLTARWAKKLLAGGQASETTDRQLLMMNFWKEAVHANAR